MTDIPIQIGKQSARRERALVLQDLLDDLHGRRQAFVGLLKLRVTDLSGDQVEAGCKRGAREGHQLCLIHGRGHGEIIGTLLVDRAAGKVHDRC